MINAEKMFMDKCTALLHSHYYLFEGAHVFIQLIAQLLRIFWSAITISANVLAKLDMTNYQDSHKKFEN